MSREEVLAALVVGELHPAVAAVRERLAADPDLRAEWAALSATMAAARRWDEVREAMVQADLDVPAVDVRAAICAFQREDDAGSNRPRLRRWPTLAVVFAAAAALLLWLLVPPLASDAGLAPDVTLGARAMALAPDSGPLPPDGQLTWSAPVDAVAFVVELELASGERLRSRELTSPNWTPLADHPRLQRQPFRWRVLTLGTDGAESVSYWARVAAQ